MLKKHSKETLAVTLLVALAFLYRFFHLTSIGWVEPDGTSALLGMRLTSVSVFHFSDTDYYNMIAENFLKGGGMNIPFPPPFTVWFLIAIYSFFGQNFFAAKIIYALLGSLSLIPIYLISRELFGKEVAIINSAICSVSFTLIAITASLNIENLYLFCSALSLSLFLLLYNGAGVGTKAKLPLAFLFGLTAAAATLTRSEFVLIVAILFFFGLFKKGWSVRVKGEVFLSALVGFILLLSPWAVRNYHYMKTFNAEHPSAELPVFVPVALNGPFNFLEGHHKDANGTYAPYVTGDIEEGYHSSLNPNDENHLAMVRDGYSIGWSFIKENWQMELGLLPTKAKVFLNGFSNGFFLNNFPAGLNGEIPNMADSFVPKSRLGLILGMILFAVGVYEISKMKEKGSLRFLPLYILAVPLFISFIFYALSRMVFPLLPFYYLIISVGVHKFLLSRGWLLNRYPRELFAVFIIIATLLGLWQSADFRVIVKGEQGELGRHTLSLRKTF